MLLFGTVRRTESLFCFHILLLLRIMLPEDFNMKISYVTFNDDIYIFVYKKHTLVNVLGLIIRCDFDALCWLYEHVLTNDFKADFLCQVIDDVLDASDNYPIEPKNLSQVLCCLLADCSLRIDGFIQNHKKNRPTLP